MQIFKKLAAVVAAVAVVALAVKPVDVKAANEVAIKLDPSITVDWVNNEPGSYAQELQVLAVMTGNVTFGDVYGVRITFKNPDFTSGAGGTITFGGPSNNWWNSDTNSTQASEFGNEGADKRLTMTKVDGTDDYAITFLNTESVFPASETQGQLVIRQYWGEPLTVCKIEFLGADGKAVLSTAPAVVPPTPQPETGVSHVAIVVAGLVMLVGAAFVGFTAKKRA